eukprot:TRINITY_DN16877_c0_g1_i1.p1 TRINITY_DN16877_c0_g1~~TRINITY_DN16877_c0_g1_i1.p1  ORF type:complete len:782 (+),score=132.40 TRINITY_DN16877_c0_g1_i1:369-2714(+)
MWSSCDDCVASTGEDRLNKSGSPTPYANADHVTFDFSSSDDEKVPGAGVRPLMSLDGGKVIWWDQFAAWAKRLDPNGDGAGARAGATAACTASPVDAAPVASPAKPPAAKAPTHLRVDTDLTNKSTNQFHTVADALNSSKVFYSKHAHELAPFQLTLDGMWPFVMKWLASWISSDLQETIQGLLKDVMPRSTFSFSRVELGRSIPKVIALTTRGKDEWVDFCLDLDWVASDAEIEVALGGLRAGLNNVRIQVSVLVGLSPLLEVLPITGGVGIALPNAPNITFDWTGIGRAFPSDLIRNIIDKAITEVIVVPNRIFVDIAGLNEVETVHKPRAINYRSPAPVGVLRIEVVAAQDLMASDIGGLSDPFVVVRVGNSEYRTKTISNTLNPQWKQFSGHDFLVDNLEQYVKVDVYDEDVLRIEHLGSAYYQRRRDAGGSDDAAERLPPTVAQVIERPGMWWPLTTVDSNGIKSTVRLHCQFMMIDEDLDMVNMRTVICPQLCGLVPAKSRHYLLWAPTCDLCGKSMSVPIKNRLFQQRAKGMMCKKCDYRICGRCRMERKPACAVLRLELKTAHVPHIDSEAGVVIHFEFGSNLAMSQSARIPESGTTWEKADAINNLKWVAGLDNQTISQCLNMSVENVEQALDPKLRAAAAKSKGPGAPAYVSKQKVEWDQAFYYLVRDQEELDVPIKVKYVAGSCTKYGKLPLPLTLIRSDATSWFSSATCEVGDKKSPVTLNIDMELLPLTPNLIHACRESEEMKEQSHAASSVPLPKNVKRYTHHRKNK